MALAWLDRFRTRRRTPDQQEHDEEDPWGAGSSGVWPDNSPDATGRPPSDLSEWETFDLVSEAQRLLVPQWPAIARSLGAADGQIGLPKGIEGEVPPAINQVRRAAQAELSRVHDAFIVRKQWLRAEVRRMRLMRQHSELKYLEELNAYHRSSVGASLEPRYGSLDEARGADDERRAAPEPLDARAQADVARNWSVPPVWYWLSTIVLIGAELPLSYTLADSIVVETGAGWLTTVAPWMLAVSMTTAILVTVKLAGTLLRRAQTLLQLRQDVYAQARRDTANSAGDADRTVTLPVDPAVEDEANAYTAAGYLRVIAASVLVVLLVGTVLLLAQFRGEAFASITRQERESAAAEAAASIDDPATGEAGDDTEIVPDVGADTLGNLFLGVLLLSTLSGVILAWVSTDPEKETSPGPDHGRWWELGRGNAPGDKQTHRGFVQRIDKWRGELLDVDFSVARCEEALKQLDERGVVARERILGAAAVAESEYWKANQAWRHNVLPDVYLRWLTEQLGTPPDLPPPPPGWAWEPPTPSDDWDPEEGD